MMNKYRNGLEQNQRDRRTTLTALCAEFALCVEVLNKARAMRTHKAYKEAGVVVSHTGGYRCVPYTEAPMIADIHAALDRTGMSPGSVRS